VVGEIAQHAPDLPWGGPRAVTRWSLHRADDIARCVECLAFQVRLDLAIASCTVPRVHGLPQIRFFSLREANALIITLQEQFERARELRDELSAVQSQLASAGHPLSEAEFEVDKTAPAAVQRLQRAASGVLDELREVLREIAELGVEVKAADGLVDFRTRLHGRTVCLCWRYGEERITHYHELETGFAGRRPLPDDGDFLGDFLH
jgi:hypothetical protein